MRRRTLVLCLLPAWAASAMAQADLAQTVRVRLQQPEWLRGDFTQTKQVQGFAKPLVSSGSFVAARGRGVVWRTVKPFAAELRLSQHEIRATQEGRTTLRMDASREPAVRVINTLMFSLLNGDVGQLADVFQLSGSAEGPTWQLSLTPKAGALQQVLKQVSLEGDGFVRRIRLHDALGDESLILLANLRTDVPEPGLFP